MSDTNDKRRVPAGELSHICAWSDEKLVKLREYKLALDLRDSRAECERWRELHNIKEACREHAEQELAALRDAVRCLNFVGNVHPGRPMVELDWITPEQWERIARLLKDDEGGGEAATVGASAEPGNAGATPARPSSDCPNCNGTGALAEGTREQMGCAKCDGRGYTITHQKDRATCEPCRGTGKDNMDIEESSNQ